MEVIFEKSSALYHNQTTHFVGDHELAPVNSEISEAIIVSVKLAVQEEKVQSKFHDQVVSL
jgi:hypothetical protein